MTPSSDRLRRYLVIGIKLQYWVIKSCLMLLFSKPALIILSALKNLLEVDPNAVNSDQLGFQDLGR